MYSLSPKCKHISKYLDKRKLKNCNKTMLNERRNLANRIDNMAVYIANCDQQS